MVAHPARPRWNPKSVFSAPRDDTATIPRARVAETGQKRIPAGLTGAPYKIAGA